MQLHALPLYKLSDSISWLFSKQHMSNTNSFAGVLQCLLTPTVNSHA